jgi:hypothetical protein
MKQKELHLTSKDFDSRGRYLGPVKFDRPFRGDVQIEPGLGTLYFCKNFWLSGRLLLGSDSELRAGASIRAAEIEAGGTITASDHVLCRGNVRARHLSAGGCLEVGGMVRIAGSLRAGSFLRAGGDVEVGGALDVHDYLTVGRSVVVNLGITAGAIRAGSHIFCGGIRAEGSVRSGGNISSRTDIRCAGGISALGNIAAGTGILASESIMCRRLSAGSCIMAGVSTRLPDAFATEPLVCVHALERGIIARGTLVILATRKRKRPHVDHPKFRPNKSSADQISFTE